MGLLQLLRNEFRLANFSLNFENNIHFLEKDPEEILEYFHNSIWPCCNRLLYLIYRTAIAIYYTIWFIESIFRNAEYRAQNFTMSNKQKTNVLHLHPWPFYMTSWSLTILFVHLWLSDFIVLYFYSVSRKSVIYSIFTHIFGPFSCSKVKKSNKSFKLRTNISESKKPTRQKLSKTDETDSVCYMQAKGISAIRIDREATKPQSSLVPLSFENEVEKALISNDNHNSPKNDVDVIFLAKKSSSVESMNIKEIATIQTIKTKETYCIKKSECECPSSQASDAASRSKWIKTHVPGFILIIIKLSWLLYNQIVISAIIVTVGYFTYVYINDLETEPTLLSEIGNIHRHGVNSIVVIIDIMLLAYPVRIMHFIYTVAYGWFYALVTFLFWLYDPTRNIIYQEIDYSRPFTILGYYIALTFITFFFASGSFFSISLKALFTI